MVLSLCLATDAGAQVHVKVNLGIPVSRESWYSTDNDYYYLPEQGVYYNVRRKVYVYPENGTWVYRRTLPSRYGSYSIRTSHYVKIHDRSPFNRDNDYKQRYSHRDDDHRHHNDDHRNDGHRR